MKNSANIITFFRIILAILMFFVPPFSSAFWLCYLFAGLSDVIDGFVARLLHQQSTTGARLDSIADAVFGVSIFSFAIRNIRFPLWIWIMTALIAVIRCSSYLIGQYKYKEFSALHTYANKITGVLLFAFPLLNSLFGITATGMILCTVAMASSVEEGMITIKSKELNRDCKSIFHYKCK